MSAKTDAERQRASREARERAGLKRIDVWCRPEDATAIREFAAKLQRHTAVTPPRLRDSKRN